MFNYIDVIKKARDKRNRLTQDTQLKIMEAYIQASTDIRKKILDNLKRGYSIDYYINLEKEIDKMINELNKQLPEIINNSIIKSSDIALDTQFQFNDYVFPKDVSKNANGFLVWSNLPIINNIINGEYYKDGKTLNHRIWNITRKNKKDIELLINSNIVKGANVSELATKLNNYVNPKAKTRRKTLDVRVNQDISYQATRLARTAITHAFNETQRNNAKNNIFCKGLRWNLSPSHYERQVKRWGPDICDDYANMDGYYLGRGVFPANEYPVAHPNCLCFPTQVQPPIDDIIDRVNRWVDGGSDEELEKEFKKWKNKKEKLVYKSNKILYNNSNKSSGAVYYKRDRSIDYVFTKKEIKEQEHAYSYYNHFKNRDRENVVNKVFNNIKDYEYMKNFSKDDIRIVFKHVFDNKYELEDGYMNFIPDYDIALSIQRLLKETNEKIKEIDLIFLRHERLEYDYMNINKLDYNTAHVKANKKYNYESKVNK